MQAADLEGPIRVGIHSPEATRLAGLCCIFDTHPNIHAVPGDLEVLLADFSIGYLILDVMDGLHWLESVMTTRRLRPDIRQIILGPSGNEELVLRSITVGARAYLDSNAGPFAVRQAVETAIQGLIWAPRRILSNLVDRLLSQPELGVPMPEAILSPRERQVLDLIMIASSNREIAETLGIGERTVKAYVASLLRKTATKSRVALLVHTTQDSIRRSQVMELQRE